MGWILGRFGVDCLWILVWMLVWMLDGCFLLRPRRVLLGAQKARQKSFSRSFPPRPRRVPLGSRKTSSGSSPGVPKSSPSRPGEIPWGREEFLRDPEELRIFPGRSRGLREGPDLPRTFPKGPP